MTSTQIVPHNAKIIERDVRKMWAACAIAHGPRKGGAPLVWCSTILTDRSLLRPSNLENARVGNGRVALATCALVVPPI